MKLKFKLGKACLYKCEPLTLSFEMLVISFIYRNTNTMVIYGLFFFFLSAAPAAYGSSQARGWIGPVAAGLCHSHSNAGSEPCL